MSDGPDWLLPHLQTAALAQPPWVKKARSGLNLASNEFVHPAIEQLAAAALRSTPGHRMRAYAVPQELAELFADRFGLDPDAVVATAGSDDAIRCLAAAVFRSTGRLVLPEPNYELIAKYAALNGVPVHDVGLDPRSRNFSIPAIRAALAALDGPGLAYVSNPNGPVGTCFSLAEMHELAAACAGGGHLLVIDEAYVPYNGFDHLELRRRWPCVILVRSFSKSFGTAGARIGMLAADPALIAYLRRWYPMNPVSGMAVHLMRYLFDREDAVAATRAEIIETRDWFAAAAVSKLDAWHALPSAANFVNFDVGDPDRADAIVAGLRERGIQIRSMSGVRGLDGCLRITIADPDTMRRVLTELAAVDG